MQSVLESKMLILFPQEFDVATTFLGLMSYKQGA